MVRGGGACLVDGKKTSRHSGGLERRGEGGLALSAVKRPPALVGDYSSGGEMMDLTLQREEGGGGGWGAELVNGEETSKHGGER